MQVITSKDNEFVKHVKKLKEKKYRDQSQEFIIEGIKLVKEDYKKFGGLTLGKIYILSIILKKINIGILIRLKPILLK